MHRDHGELDHLSTHQAQSVVIGGFVVGSVRMGLATGCQVVQPVICTKSNNVRAAAVMRRALKS